MFDAAEEEGTPPPEIKEGPPLFTWLAETYSSFWRLSRQRSMGFTGPNKLLASDILGFYDAFGPHESKEEFYELITALDDVFITHAYKAIEEKKKKDGNGGL